MVRSTQVTLPVAVVNEPGGIVTQIFVLRDKTCWCQPDPAHVYKGPSMILHTKHVNGEEATVCWPEALAAWGWIEALMQVGAWARGNLKVAKLIPAELKQYWEKKT